MKTKIVSLSLALICFFGLAVGPGLANSLDSDTLDDETVSENHVDVTDAVIKVYEDRTVIELEYKMSFSLKVYTVLFGSGDLKESLKKVIDSDSDMDFKSVSQESAKLVIYEPLEDGHEFGQELEEVKLVDKVNSETEKFYNLEVLKLNDE